MDHQVDTQRIDIDTGTAELLCHIEARVAVVTLNKPEKKNALGDILTPALRTLLPILEADDRVGCVLLTGAGDAFCAGGDISGMGGGGGQAPAFDARIADLLQKQVNLTQRLYELGKPTVAALPGAAAGAGLSIALACDLRVAADTAFVTTAFANIGLSGDYGGTWFLSRLVGLGRAKEMYFTAARVSAAEALAMGLVNQVFPKQDFQAQAFAYARALANGPTAALGRMKLNLNRGVDQSLGESLALEARHMIESGGTAESREAIRAFMEKRAPVFHG
jgi:enoyl-CoA hydratase/carnithine racemase